MGFSDFHIHSVYSYDGTATISAILKYVADETDLNVIAITDHDSMAGVPEALELAPRYGIEVIPGCEISTSDGHLLGLFLNKPVQPGLSLEETALQIAAQGGICVAAHPTARGTSSLSFETIRAALQNPAVAESFVGIEAFNGGLVYTRSNPAVAAQAAELPLAQVGNSDAHVLPMIGRGSSMFEGRTAHDLRRALENHRTVVREGKGLGGLDVLRTYIPRYLLRRLGWADWNAGPEASLEYIRLSTYKLARRSVVRSY